jgi:hypothetical protein
MGIVIMGVSYSKEFLLMGRYVASVIFSGGAWGVSSSKEVLLAVSLLLGGPPSGQVCSSIIFRVGVVIMGVVLLFYSKEVLLVVGMSPLSYPLGVHGSVGAQEYDYDMSI